MEEEYVLVMYETLLDSNEGDLSPHTLQTILFFNINENKISDREISVESLSVEPQYKVLNPYWWPLLAYEAFRSILMNLAIVESILYKSKFEGIHIRKIGHCVKDILIRYLPYWN